MIKVVQLSPLQADQLNGQVELSNILYEKADESKYVDKKYNKWTLKNGEKNIDTGVVMMAEYEAEICNEDNNGYMLIPVIEKKKVKKEPKQVEQ